MVSESVIEDIDALRFDPVCVMTVNAAWAIEHMTVPVCTVDDELRVVTANPQDLRAQAELRRVTGLPVIAHRATASAIERIVTRYIGTESGGGVSDDPSDAVRTVDRLLRNAVLRDASDIHFDPEETYTRVRFRTDGVLEEVLRFPAELQPSVASRVKIMADLDIAERREPQDGAFSWEVPTEIAGHSGEFLDVRVATLPASWGERLTLRLLEKESRKLSLDALGMSPDDLRRFEGVLAQPNGMVLLTGPTGSGKSTSLYAAIEHLLSRRPLNILTVEDPIEYRIPGVVQAETDSADKVSFSKALRSLLRHDPDVIMIGEIRDEESLDTAVKAALTGHLVLSTLHTNDAVNAVTRLTDMRLARHLTAATLRLSAAQRLVRALCPHCREGYALSEREAIALGNPELAGRTVYRARGCMSCGGKGLQGRLGVFELFIPDTGLTSSIAAGAPENELRHAALRTGQPTLLEDGIRKCIEGRTTVEEILRTVGGAF